MSPELNPGCMRPLMKYDWPGNVRELENTVERGLIQYKGKGPLIVVSPVSPIKTSVGEDNNFREGYDDRGSSILNLEAMNAAYIKAILKITGAAELLDIHPNTLRNRMKRLGVPYGKGNWASGDLK